MAVVASQSADALLEGAHRAGYRYPPSFAGFAASVRAGAGTPEHVSVDVGEEGVVVDASPGLEAWATEQIRSIVSHRLGRSYQEGDGRHAKRLVEHDELLGALVEVDDGMSSSYRVLGEQLTLVTRRPGSRSFSIAVQERREVVEGTFVPKEFAVFYWDADGALEASEAYSDSYVEVESVLLPSSRRVVRADGDGVSARQVVLSDHVLHAQVAS